ncbi:MAG: hypothetical protein PVJ02_07510 [Gemmatimonadota bacterium]
MVRKRKRWMRGVMAVALAAWVAPAALSAQDLADFDYEHLSFRGIGPEIGYIWPSRVEPTQTVGVRMDLGYLGPGLRIVPSITYWKSAFKQSEIRKLEDRVSSLIVGQTGGPPPTVDLGEIDWSDVALSVDAHVVWRVPYDVLTFAGLGVSAHLLNGNGSSINGTFVEDLLDSVTAGFNLHAGAEYLLASNLRIYGEGRYEVLGDLQYPGIRIGLQLFTGQAAPGEEAGR